MGKIASNKKSADLLSADKGYLYWDTVIWLHQNVTRHTGKHIAPLLPKHSNFHFLTLTVFTIDLFLGELAFVLCAC